MPAYKTGFGRAQATIWLLGAMAIVGVISLANDVLRFVLLTQMQRGNEVPDAALKIQLSLQNPIEYLGLLVIPTAIFFFIWIYHAHSILPTLGAQNLRFTPGWAVGWWFIPIFNLFRPYQIVREIWQHSDPGLSDSSGRPQKSSWSIIGWWWACFILSTFQFTVGGAVNVSYLLLTSAVDIFVGIAWVAGAVLAVLIIRRIDRFQTSQLQRRASEEQVKGREDARFE